MKKIILLSASIASAFAASAAQANCQKVSGYNFTIGGAFKQMSGSQKIYTGAQNSLTPYKDEVKISGNGGAGVASLGYGQQGIFSPNSYLGIEANTNFGRTRSNILLTGPANNTPPIYIAGYYTSLVNKYTIGGAVKLGLVHNNTLWFLSIGGSSGRFEFSYTDVTHSVATRSPVRKKQLGAVTFGFGAQTHFKKVLLKTEVGFAHHKALKISPYRPPAYSTASPIGGKLTPRTSIASVSVGYSW